MPANAVTERIASLPDYLARFVVNQEYSYTSLEQATWRYIMRQSRRFFAEHGVGIYVEGLKKTGIPIERIPKISEMDQCLSNFGWGAVGVCGFIPSPIFLDLLAHKILPIATDMRTINHIAYTPAPDIVHEAAGHAPIIADPSYRKFLEHYAEIAYRSIISKEDILLYEAIRYLSDIKENPDTPQAEIERAELRLKQAYKSLSYVSEATKVARLAWWTIEYGLVGDIKNPKIYGAGLLSSIGESTACLSPKVKKIPLSVACVETGYDITEHQPQLFIAESLAALPDVLDNLAKTFVYQKGGKEGLDAAKKAETVNSVQFESKLSVSGILTEYSFSPKYGAEFIKFSGPAQICYEEKELEGQGILRHASGFSSPVGRFLDYPQIPTPKLSDDDLHKIGLRKNQRASLKFCNGFEVKGVLKHWVRKNSQLLYLTWTDCEVTRQGEVFYKPEWGEFDMVVGDIIKSVFSGPADRTSYGTYDVGHASTSPKRSSKFSGQELEAFEFYAKLRQLRQAGLAKTQLAQSLEELAALVSKNHKDQWLLGLEIVELAEQRAGLGPNPPNWLKQLTQTVLEKNHKDEDTRELIGRGLNLVTTAD